MSKLLEKITQKYCTSVESITKDVYEKYKAQYNEEEFNKRFFRKEREYKEGEYFYFVKTGVIPNEDDKPPFLLFKLLEEQEVATKKLRTISGIMVFTLIMSIISAIISLIIWI